MIRRPLFRPRLLGLAASILVLGALFSDDAASGDVPGLGNDIYRVLIEDEPGGDGTGTFSIETGPGHPAGGGANILFPGDNAGNLNGSYVTVRSYTTGSDYVQTRGAPSSGNIVIELDELASVSPIGNRGYRTTYDVQRPEKLRIVSEIEVVGTTFDKSRIELRTKVTNLDSVPLLVAVRYLLDLSVGGDDGPAFSRSVGGKLNVAEATYPRGFGVVRIESNNSDGTNPRLFGTATSDAGAGARRPDLLQFAYWPDAFGAAFDYTTRPRDIASTGGLDDSSLLYYFGSIEAHAIRLAPTDSLTVSLSLFGDTHRGPPQRNR